MTLYPNALYEPLLNHSAPGTLAQRKMIVLHITGGSTAAGAIATFKASIAPHRVSAHFVVDRTGFVIQLLPLEDTAWHASACNSSSVGIVHVAVPAGGPMPYFPPTDVQYMASSVLVAWLCRTLGIPCDREHVVGHNEASPGDHHVGCCAPTLDPDRIVNMALELFELEDPK